MNILLAVKNFIVRQFKYPKPFNWGYPVFFAGVGVGIAFLLLKLFYRVIGFEHISESHILNILFLFGLCAMIFPPDYYRAASAYIRYYIAFLSPWQLYICLIFHLQVKMQKNPVFLSARPLFASFLAR